jgi:glyoxylase-like metal-dependent hydrolase (beta-lactamase superfamily II)
MTEPRSAAPDAKEVVPGVWHWAIADERIGGYYSAGHALAGTDGAVLIDPVPLAPAGLERIGPVSAICLTTSSHQRSAWRYRREFGVEVWAPELARTFEEQPDRRYGDGDELPEGLRAFFTPGAGTSQHTLLAIEPAVVFVPDLLTRAPGEPLALISAEYAHDIDEARQSVQGLLALPFDVLCLGHGEPIADDPKDAIRSLLGA